MLTRLLTLLWLCLITTSASAVSFGDEAPSWSGTDLNSGSQIEFPSVLANKPAVLVFWATWCPYCKAFMPYVKEIQADYEKHGVQVISFNALERGKGDPKAYVDSLNFPFIAIADADGIAEDYKVKFIPGLLITDGNGKIVYRRKSTDLPAGKTVSEQWANEVRKVLDILLE
ncbi:MAG: TlpA family protein disulfide reductase [Gammaproteobacteria bacterium]|jgi:thiol-disulfide isomerase/thioredoxin|nr:TlpA family protein disulfide reductase [Gammaproteobacteria bacterium]